MSEQQAEKKKFKVLIADDNRDMVFLVKKGIGLEECLFVEAADGEETIRKVREEKPDILLLDLKMPKKSGLEVIRELREMFDFRDLPIIVLTVVENPEEKIKALELGASDFLVKPPSSAELKARVSTQLQLHRISTIFKRYSEHLETILSRKTREIRDFGDRLEEMVDERVGVIKRQNEELMISLRSAQRIQKSFLPTEFPKVSGVAFKAVYEACETVGGDIYNVFRIDEDTIGIFIADVSGHGIPSAMITIFMKQEVVYHAKQVHLGGGYTVSSPAELLKQVNRSFIQNNIGEGIFFVTAVYCTYSLKKRELVYAVAGHHALPILKRADGGVTTLRIEGFPIGWFEDIEEYTEMRCTLEKGDSLLFYTDGLFELCQEGGCEPQAGGAAVPGGSADAPAAAREPSIDDLIKPISDTFRGGDIERAVKHQLDKLSRHAVKLKDDLTLLLMEII